MITKPVMYKLICEHDLLDESHAVPSEDCCITGGFVESIEQSSPTNPLLQVQKPF